MGPTPTADFGFGRAPLETIPEEQPDGFIVVVHCTLFGEHYKAAVFVRGTADIFDVTLQLLQVGLSMGSSCFTVDGEDKPLKRWMKLRKVMEERQIAGNKLHLRLCAGA